MRLTVHFQFAGMREFKPQNKEGNTRGGKVKGKGRNRNAKWGRGRIGEEGWEVGGSQYLIDVFAEVIKRLISGYVTIFHVVETLLLFPMLGKFVLDLLRKTCVLIAEAASIVYEICKAIEYLHSREIAHRDVKVGVCGLERTLHHACQ
jgi:serine/threonine protein kinase